MNRKINSPHLRISIMAGLILMLFEKKQYCASEIDAVLKIIKKRVDHYKRLEPIEFWDSDGSAREIKEAQEEILNKYLLTVLK
ncbi:MAG: hypothetical protein LKF34_03600 [Acidaminococcaceae bacterium]|jgi:hypothetical protein|nr:hypothetical protein [Acidaminococcaceae bacterium]